MWDRNKLTPFTQFHNSCTLGSYGVALAFPSGNQIISFFNSYVRHYQLGTPQDAEEASAEDFQERTAHRSGFSVLEELHSTSAGAFRDARDAALCTLIPRLEGATLSEVVKALVTRPAVVLVATQQGNHVNCFGCDGAGAWMAETTPQWVVTTGTPAQVVGGGHVPDALLIEFLLRGVESQGTACGPASNTE